MQLQNVNSSQINAIGHDSATNKLRIEFKTGSLYEYDNVPPDLFAEFAKAPSTGSFFYKHIKPFADKFPYVRLDNSKAEESAAGATPPASDAVHHPTDPEQPIDPVPPPPGG